MEGIQLKKVQQEVEMKAYDGSPVAAIFSEDMHCPITLDECVVQDAEWEESQPTEIALYSTQCSQH